MKPSSATHFGLNALALACLGGAIALLHGRPMDGDLRVLLLLLAAAVPAGIGDLAILKVHRRASTGLDWERPFAFSLARVLTKLLGLAATVAAIGFAYWVFPEYGGTFYAPFYRLLAKSALPLVVVAVAYVALVDGRMRQPRDAYWQLGRFLLGRSEDARSADLADHARAWLVKAFFLPLMVVYLHGSAARVLNFGLSGTNWANLRLYDFAYDTVFLVDLVFTVAGYALSLRAADAHIRSAEPTMLGWVVALLCYQPFFSLFDRNYLAYGGPGFGTMLAGWPSLRMVWAGVIIALLALYSLTTVTFGWRFSNLTHRGILTGGPFRFTKHPAYVTKNISWWLISVPFAVQGGAEQARHMLMLLCLNAVYFMRARTEERHLSRDPEYVAYALWMNDHGLFRALGRWFPFLRYRPPSRVA